MLVLRLLEQALVLGQEEPILYLSVALSNSSLLWEVCQAWEVWAAWAEWVAWAAWAAQEQVVPEAQEQVVQPEPVSSEGRTVKVRAASFSSVMAVVTVSLAATY